MTNIFVQGFLSGKVYLYICPGIPAWKSLLIYLSWNSCLVKFTNIFVQGFLPGKVYELGRAGSNRVRQVSSHLNAPPSTRVGVFCQLSLLFLIFLYNFNLWISSHVKIYFKMRSVITFKEVEKRNHNFIFVRLIGIHLNCLWFPVCYLIFSIFFNAKWSLGGSIACYDSIAFFNWKFNIKLWKDSKFSTL